MAPNDLGPRGRAFWRDTVSTFALERDERELLAELCRELDVLDRLRVVVEADGVAVRGSTGQPRVHPGLAEMRASRALVGRLLAQLHLPDADGAGRIDSPETARARRAAEVRWDLAREHGRG